MYEFYLKVYLIYIQLLLIQGFMVDSFPFPLVNLYKNQIFHFPFWEVRRGFFHFFAVRGLENTPSFRFSPALFRLSHRRKHSNPHPVAHGACR